MTTKKKATRHTDDFSFAATEVAAAEPEKAETMEEQGIAAADPYPTGSPPDPADEFYKIHGFYAAPPAGGV